MSLDDGPEYSLAKAKELVAEGRSSLDPGSKALDALFDELGSLVAVYNFVPLLFEELVETDYCRTIEIRALGIEGTYDEYALRISVELADRFELTKRNWYLKFKVTEVRGQKVFFLSFHPLHKDEHGRRGGPLLRERS